MAKEIILGIDLGTTNSCVAVINSSGEPYVLENAEGNRTTPSIVSYTQDNQILVGRPAKNQAESNTLRTVFAIKRLIGQSISFKSTIEKLLPYKVISQNDQLGVEIDDKFISPEEISAKILSKLVKDAETKLGTKIKKVVITVPAYFNDAQRQATKNAAKIAGLHVERLVNEPTAAALAYGLDKKKSGTIAVYDLGGGTFDISILEISDGIIEVKSTNGDTVLGGEDFDNILITEIATKFKKEHEIDLLKDPQAKQRLKKACEDAKIELSSTTSTQINIPYISASSNGPLHLTYTITRSGLEKMMHDLIERTKKPCLQALKDAGLTVNDIDEVVLVGGMTRMPAVSQMVEKFFNKKPHQGVNPDEVVALGAAVQAGVLQGDVKDVLLLDVTPLSLGIEVEGGLFSRMIERNTTIPIKKTQTYSTAADNQTAVSIRVFQGEREIAVENKLLGQFDLVGIDPAPRGVPQVEVAFDIDSDGIVKVSAKDKKTGKEHTIEIKDSTGLSEAEIQKAIKDAEIHAEADKERKEVLEKINQAQTIIYATEKSMKDHENELPAEDKTNINNALNTLHEAINAKDKTRIDSAITTLNNCSGKLTELVQNASKNTDNSNAKDTHNTEQVHDVESSDA